MLFANLLSVFKLRVRFVEHCNKNVSDNLNKVERMAGVCHLSADYSYIKVVRITLRPKSLVHFYPDMMKDKIFGYTVQDDAMLFPEYAVGPTGIIQKEICNNYT